MKVDHAGRCSSFRPKSIASGVVSSISLIGRDHQMRCRIGFVDEREPVIRTDVRLDQCFGEFAIFNHLNGPCAEGDELFIGIDS